MQIFLILGLLASGLIAGSYIGALTYRLPRRMSIAKGRSICDFCKKKISWYDNIPVISYIILGGKCRLCKKSILLRYPAVEIATALLFILTGFTVKFSFLPFYLIIISGLVAIFVIDLEESIIPDSIVFFLYGLTLLFLIFMRPESIYINMLTGFFAGLFFLLIHLITLRRGMGLGDVKFALLGGTLLGFPNTLVFLFLSFLTGASVGIILILIKRAKFGKPIPFGPYLVFGVTVVLLFGDYLLERWLQ